VRELPQHPREKLFPSYNGLNPPDKSPSINKFTTTFLPNQAEICWQCHQQIRAANFKPSHHPIIEGKVKCSDCHNPHGAITPAMLKQPTINDQCYSCHATSAARSYTTTHRSRRTAQPATTRTARSTRGS
jgi:predicted CXXCH cytochrome family protein